MRKIDPFRTALPLLVLFLLIMLAAKSCFSQPQITMPEDDPVAARESRVGLMVGNFTFRWKSSNGTDIALEVPAAGPEDAAAFYNEARSAVEKYEQRR